MTWLELQERLFGRAPPLERPPQIVKPEPRAAAVHAVAGFRGAVELREAIVQMRAELVHIEQMLGEDEPRARTWEALQHRFERLSVACRATTGRCRLGARAAHKSLDGELRSE